VLGLKGELEKEKKIKDKAIHILKILKKANNLDQLDQFLRDF